MINPIPVFVQVILPLALVWVVGYLGRRLLRLDPQPFSRAGLYLLTPAVIFTTLMDSKITAGEGVRIIAVVVLLTISLWIVSWLQTRLFKLDPQESSAFVLSSVFINAVNYGFPVALLALGQTGLERAAVFAVAHAFLSNTCGAYIAASGQAGGVRATLGKVARIPMLYAVALAVGLRTFGITFTQPFQLASLEIPFLPSIYQAIKLLSQAAIPVFMLVLGMQLGNNGGKDPASPRLLWPTVAASVTRLLISPALAWGIATLIGLQGMALRATVLEAAMPSAVLNVILSIEFNTRPKFVSTMVVVTTLASMVTLTLLLSVW